MSVGRWLGGWLRVSVQSPQTVRLVNRLWGESIPLWGFCLQEGGFLLCCRAKDYRRFARLVRDSGGRCRIRQKFGFPFWFRPYRRRKGLLVGWAIWGCFMLTAPRFVWEIRLPSLPQEQEVSLQQLLAEQHITVGMPIAALDTLTMQEQMEHQTDEFAWIALNRRGSVLEVAVSTRTFPPKESRKAPCDLVAASAGVVQSVRVSVGIPVVETGDVVVAGELLVSGLSESASTAYRHAEGEVWARTVHEETLIIPPTLTETTVVKECAASSFEIMGLILPNLYPWKYESLPYTEEITKAPLVINGHTLPFARRITTRRYTAAKSTAVSETMAKQLAEAHWDEIHRSYTAQGRQILSVEESQSTSPRGISITRRYHCLENLAIPRFVDREQEKNEKFGYFAIE